MLGAIGGFVAGAVLGGFLGVTTMAILVAGDDKDD